MKGMVLVEIESVDTNISEMKNCISIARKQILR